jgi:hypothetical protein
LIWQSTVCRMRGRRWMRLWHSRSRWCRWWQRWLRASCCQLKLPLSTPQFWSSVIMVLLSLYFCRLLEMHHIARQVCGNVVTESIFMAVKPTRDFMKATCGIIAPEMWDPRLVILMGCYLNMWLWDFWQRQFQWIHILWESTLSSKSSYYRATRTVWATVRRHMCWCGEWWEQPAKRHLHEQPSGLKR